MKKLLKSVVLFVSFALVATSCDDSAEVLNTAEPTVEILSLGSAEDHHHEEGEEHAEEEHEGHMAHIGEELHYEAKIVAPGKIAKITMTIQKDGKVLISENYDSENGKLNVDEFHPAHVSIPAEAEAGEYEFSVVVTDEFGQTGKDSEKLTLEVEGEE